MAKSVLMPQVGQDLTEGVLVEWNVKIGDPVKKGDIVALVESEKASFEVEAFEDGTVTELLYKEGDLATVLEPILYLDGAGDETGEAEEKPAPAANDSKPADAPEKATEPEKTAPTPATADTGAKKSGKSSSPLARRLAQKHSLDIGKVTGTGPKGAVVKRDIEAAVASGAAASAPAAGAPAARPAPATLPMQQPEDREEPFNRMRQVIADRLLLSKQTIPHFYLRSEVDVTDLLIRRQAHLDMGGEKVSFNDVIVHATALTLLEYPRMNAHVGTDKVVLKGSVNVGVAVSVDNGLVVPVIENTPYRSVVEISETIRDYAAAARRGMQKSVAPGTFSISNLGMFGVEVQPIINPPEAGILGVGPIKRAVCEHRGGIQMRDIMTLTLSGDHRAVDGAYGAQFLQALGETISTYAMFADPAPTPAS
ncbi:MAG: dihydrolipoamide acetyltransferase family protein [Alphaproteobacteria bacterium]